MDVYFSSSSFNESNCKCNGECSTLENEAYAAVSEVATFVKIFCISEVLARSPDLLFFNLVILEDKCYCIELTQRGWRICSERLDCMYGDFRHPELFAKYFETIYQLLDQISPDYRKKFSESLKNKLEQLTSS